ncbi:lysozyme inhibitor LprI family protein [Sphingomonas psychrotolerans]|uniref:Lysozyme inhibitor LprI-like N-terminal domain-containing protein n=1 Tax=Sphingomonas psychrotolerans TaxID=1327635 RepID=A0A2K8MBE9_9SPHN|nr:lysozyme inhibitor LprI family protein [Sphingomonas psychrotolerans]ATY31167.1 hypothetical protein CVN68_03540 [Sphingomonas psychrotolerans]
MMLSALLLLAVSPEGAAALPEHDPTEAALQRCIAAPANASTAGQTECEAQASSDYDRRLNVAYTSLTRRLSAAAATRLRTAQRAWLSFRSADGEARSALYATRKGTMYVPMQAGAATNIIRDRALQLENDLRVMTIDG